MLRCLRLWTSDDRGVTSIEYAILAALISCGIIASTRTLGNNLAGVFSAVASGLDSSATVAPPAAVPNAVHGGS